MTEETTKSLLEILTLGYLVKHARGAAAARCQSRIARDLRALGVDATPRQVRDGLAALVDLGAPIGTTCGTPGGAFLCETRKDFERGYRNLAVRFQAQARRCRRFKQTARETLSGQQRFDFAEAREAFADLEARPLLALAESKIEPAPAEGSGRT